MPTSFLSLTIPPATRPRCPRMVTQVSGLVWIILKLVIWYKIKGLRYCPLYCQAMLAGSKVHIGTHLHLLRSSGYGLRGVAVGYSTVTNSLGFCYTEVSYRHQRSSTSTPVRTTVRDTVTGSSVRSRHAGSTSRPRPSLPSPC